MWAAPLVTVLSTQLESLLGFLMSKMGLKTSLAVSSRHSKVEKKGVCVFPGNPEGLCKCYFPNKHDSGV